MTNTYFVSNNKTRICAIWQTDKERKEAQDELNWKEWDAFITCETVAQAQNLVMKGNYQVTQIDDFK